jgi:hypothetical protein
MLKIQYALDKSQKVCNPETAPKGEKYYCPGCGEEVILRRGEERVAHFSHKSDTQCTQESILHKTAKKLIVESITNDRSKVRILRHCDICGSSFNQPLPFSIVSAIEEYRLESGFIADIGLLDAAKAQAAIEVHVTHYVDERKENEIGIPFIEVEGADIVKDSINLKPIKDRLFEYICRDCRDGAFEYLDECKRIADLYSINLPTSHFRYAISSCWKCHIPIIVFAWEDFPSFIDPPKTLQRINNQPSGNEWANFCPACKNMQGEYYLHMEEEGPFFGLDLSYNEEEFEKDMMRIAYTYKKKIDLRDE